MMKISSPQEALAQALRKAEQAHPGQPCADAAAILDALPEGWYLNDEESFTDDIARAREQAAQQERERLRREHCMNQHGSYAPQYMTGERKCYVCAFLADPEAEPSSEPRRLDR